MRVPLSLLRSFCPVAVDVLELARVMNARVSEVEAIHRFPSREAFCHVAVVELIEPVSRQNEHTLWRTSARPIVVADKFGVVAGGRYAAVIAGGALPDGSPVGERKIAGLPSEGMLVSELHLGIGKDAARPLRFAPEVAVGANTFDVLELDDIVLEFDLEPNRSDLYSLLGMARDASAIWSLPLASPARTNVEFLPTMARPTIDIRTPRARRYEALLLRGIRVGPSPQWLQNAVRKLGMRPINNVVDAANLVMMEYGQPLHTFDLAHLRSDAIVLRMAENGEQMTTLDGVRRTLTDECLLVCDGAHPVALAGVMGDAHSEVGDGTTEVLIESAAFDMAAVRRASRRLSLRTEASLRFEKGLPIAGVRPAMERLAFLLASVAGGSVVSVAQAGEAPRARTEIALDRDFVRARLAMDIADAGIDRILRALGFDVASETVRVPESRPDVKLPDDLVEEVGRIHGYEHVRSIAPTMSLVAPRANPIVVASARARRILTAHGWDEVYLPAWIGDAEVDRFSLERAALIALINPIAENLKYFRTTALPALLEAAIQNRKEYDGFGLFEVGKLYRRHDGAVDEAFHLAGIAIGFSLLALRDTLAALGRASGADVNVGRAVHPHLHPGRAFSLGDWLVAGELHPRLVRESGLREAPVYFAADLQRIAALAPPLTRFAAPPRFPSIDLDLNVTVPPRTEAAAVLAAVPTVPLLSGARVRDVYPLPVGARVTLSLTFNAVDRSMTSEEAASGLAHVRASLKERGWLPA